jgi:pilus assembly protein CpaB
MRSHSRALPLALALASGLATAGLMYAFIKGHAQTPAPVAQEPMVVAATALEESRPLTAEALSVIQVPHRPDGAFASATELIGRMPLVPVPKGQPVLSSHLAAEGARPALWYRIPAGKRAVTVAIDEVAGVGGFLKPGLHVDIVSVARGDDTWTTRTIAQDVPILAVAQDDKSKQEDTNAKVAPSATLLVTPTQAEAVSLATEQGKIRLMLRAPEDHAIVRLSAIKTTPAHKPAPAAPAPAAAAPVAPPPAVVAPPAPAPVAVQVPPPPKAPAAPGIEVIRGNESEVVTP